jgi:hypothetical protein
MSVGSEISCSRGSTSTFSMHSISWIALVEVRAIRTNPGEAAIQIMRSAEPGGRVLLGWEFALPIRRPEAAYALGPAKPAKVDLIAGGFAFVTAWDATLPNNLRTGEFFESGHDHDPKFRNLRFHWSPFLI